jgi:REP element-mobilizing transposase RayT
VTSRGNERRNIFRDDRDRVRFLELVAEMIGSFGVLLHAYVLMDNHYHLMVELLEANLSRAAQWLNQSYCQWFNRRHDRSGHLFQGRFKSVILQPDSWGLELSRYIHLNPVRVGKLGLSKSARQQIGAGVGDKPKPEVVRERIAKLRQYRWSSYRAYIGLSKAPEWLECDTVLKWGGGRKGEERKNYREYVETAVREGLEASPWEQLKEQVVLGGVEFLAGLKEQLTGDEREQRAARRLRESRPDVRGVIRCVEGMKGQKWEQFRDRHGDTGRDLVLYLGRKVCGLRLNELAAVVGVKEYATVAMAVKRFEARLNKEQTLRQECQKVNQLLYVKM